MPAEINITDKDIIYAEKILLPDGQLFDDERRLFIKNLETIDLQAVPGSGKTTALLAKLLIIEKYLPFETGSGVLVISHTNAAIDEIKNKIFKYCPKLFSYPNFVGTIQSFVNEFLAFPCYTNEYKRKPYRIDNEIYDEKIKKYYDTLSQYDLKQWLNRRNEPLAFLQKIRFDIDKNLIPELNKLKTDFELKDNTKPIYQSLKKLKENLLDWGYLHFDDAYFLATYYISKYPKIINIIQTRFRYIFVDEMQDMDIHQYELLEKLFYNDGNSISNFQRIGDKNQAIFNGSTNLDNIWNNREKNLKLKGSYRLTSVNANIVKYFGLEFIDIEGKNPIKPEIKPRIIIFDDQSINEVLKTFAELIKQLQKENAFPINPKYPCKAIAWRKDELENKKIGLRNYWNNFEDNCAMPKEDYQNLENYLLYYDKNIKMLRPIKKNIINALLRVLRYENIYFDVNNKKNYTKQLLLSSLKESKYSEYEKLKLYLYKWSIEIVKGKKEIVFNEIKNYITEFLALFEKNIHKSREFIENRNLISPPNKSSLNNENLIVFDGVKIEIGTIHSVKGQTHSATLYLETYFQKKHESDRLAGQFKGNNFSSAKTYDLQSTKMLYVGLSRPTHLLCFALHKDRFNQNNFLNEWEFIDISNRSLRNQTA